MSEPDMSKFIAPKSDQLNADDLVAGPQTMRIVSVKFMENDGRPFWFYFEEYPKRPWKPCLTQRRLIVELWGGDVSKYAGRTIEFFRDPKVVYAGAKVGGIRVQALSDIAEDKWVVVTESEKKRTQYHVKRLDVTQRKQAPPPDDPKPPGNITEALATIASWAGDLGPLKTGLQEKSWTKEERLQIKQALEGKAQ